jgi:hypothetical protein
LTYQRVSSSSIAEIGYDGHHKTLAIHFHSGRKYWYAGVPRGTYRALLAAASIGGYFNAQIRDAYPYQRAR